MAMMAAAAVLAGCAKTEVDSPAEEKTPREEVKTWTVSMEAAKAADVSTKADAGDGWEGEEPTKSLVDDNGRIDFFWSGTDYLEAYKGDVHVGTFSTAGGSNSCRFTGKLKGDFSVGDQLALKFLLGNVSDPSQQYANQKGTLEDLARRFDYAQDLVQVTSVNTAESRISLSPASLKSCQSITLFSFRYPNSDLDGIRKLTITSTALEHPVTVIPESPGTEFYVAIPGKEGVTEKQLYDFLAETEDGKRYSSTLKARLENGKCYRAANRVLSSYEPVKEPLTIEALEAGTLEIANPLGWDFYYGINTNVMNKHAFGSDIRIDLKEGDRIILGGHHPYGSRSHGSIIETATPEGTTISYTYTNIRFPGRHYVFGNVMSLIDFQQYGDQRNALMLEAAPAAFFSLFTDNTQLLNHPSKDIVLPATTVFAGAYGNMFLLCENLTRAPELPATELKGTGTVGHYEGMFERCFSLKRSPAILPATKLPNRAYARMFEGCTSLEASPVLPAESPGKNSYFRMFFGCTSLKQITCYAKENLGWTKYYIHRNGELHLQMEGGRSNYTGETHLGATYLWVNGVPEGGTFVSAPGASWPSGINGIPDGWNGYVDPLTLEARAAGTITISNPRNLSITYGKEASIASAVTENHNPIVIPVNAGDKVRFWGDNPAYGEEHGHNTVITPSASCYVYGDVRSLISRFNYNNIDSLEPYAFQRLFASQQRDGEGRVVTVPLTLHPTKPLGLSATKLGAYCYSGMFEGTALTKAPALPAKKLAEECYSSMFASCQSLTEAPALPATTLAQSCYSNMFAGCTSLAKAPELPATTLAENCYEGMFQECTSLKNAPSLQASTPAPMCYAYMFRGCSSLRSLGCRAETLLSSDDESAPNYMSFEQWLEGVSSDGLFTKMESASWERSVSSIPNGWIVLYYQ